MVLRILHPILASTLCAANPLARIAERRCCTARSKSLTSLCRLQSHPAQYVFEWHDGKADRRVVEVCREVASYEKTFRSAPGAGRMQQPGDGSRAEEGGHHQARESWTRDG